jgi:hypothetical protein
LFFDGITALCLSPFGFRAAKSTEKPPIPGDPFRRMNRRSRKSGLRAAALNNPKDFFDRLSRRMSSGFFVCFKVEILY